MKKQPIIEVYPDNAGLWRWRIQTKNGKIVGGSEESFDSVGNAMRAAKSLQRIVANCVVVRVNPTGLPVNPDVPEEL